MIDIEHVSNERIEELEKAVEELKYTVADLDAALVEIMKLLGIINDRQTENQ